ncbi:MAG TPA: hypothetical protein PKN69_02620, partial [Candidatus Latescibacteria bacterium]|nr:hypothetical protein [Candidatus Latescibacterota bacterium]
MSSLRPMTLPIRMPVPYGEPGELVLTALTKQAMPILRYRTRDIARFAVGDWLQGIRINAFHEEMVLLDMHSVAHNALPADARADDLAEAVVVEGKQT